MTSPILTLVLIDIQRDFNVAHAAIGALGTVTLLMRLVGGAVAGAAADRWGRKLPADGVHRLVLSVRVPERTGARATRRCSCAVRFFGLGMGGEWAAGMPLVLEHYPESRRGLVMGVLQGAFSWGFILAAGVFHLALSLAAGWTNRAVAPAHVQRTGAIAAGDLDSTRRAGESAVARGTDRPAGYVRASHRRDAAAVPSSRCAGRGRHSGRHHVRVSVDVILVRQSSARARAGAAAVPGCAERWGHRRRRNLGMGR
jgi:hypothetical protein